MDVTDVSTPKDWPQHVREFISLEQLLRCEICFNFFTTCMMTQCSHNFCSLCIRRHLSLKESCPICFRVIYETELRNNRLIDELVKSFQASRSKLLEMMKESFNGDSGPIKIIDKSCDKPPSAQKHYITMLDESTDTDNDVLIIPTVSPGACSSTRRRPRTEILSKRAYLPKRAYGLMKLKEIKECLTKVGLSTKGQKEDLVRRMKQYVIVYNAECDAENPRSVAALIKEVENDELAKQRYSNLTGKVFKTNHKSNPDDIEKERKQYTNSHTSHFQKLITDLKDRKYSNNETKTSRLCKTTQPSSALSQSQEYSNLLPLESKSGKGSSGRTSHIARVFEKRAALDNAVSIADGITASQMSTVSSLTSSDDFNYNSDTTEPFSPIRSTHLQVQEPRKHHKLASQAIFSVRAATTAPYTMKTSMPSQHAATIASVVRPAKQETQQTELVQQILQREEKTLSVLVSDIGRPDSKYAYPVRRSLRKRNLSLPCKSAGKQMKKASL